LKKLEVIVPELLSQYAPSNSEPPIPPELQKSLAITEWAAYIYLTYAVAHNSNSGDTLTIIKWVWNFIHGSPNMVKADTGKAL
jgi:hypothetical protein